MNKIVTITTVSLICAASFAAAGCGGASYTAPKSNTLIECPTQAIEFADRDYQYETEELCSDYYEPDYSYDYNEYDSDFGSQSDGEWHYYETGDEKKRYSIITDSSEYQHGYSSPYYEETTVDHRYYDASQMYEYTGHVFSAKFIDLEFTLTGVYDNGDQIEVVFSKCQYELTGIDLGSTYTGYLENIKGGNFTTMDGYYRFAFPFLDEWEDGSRHEDTFYLEFSFGGRDGEFCMSTIGLLSDTLYMR